MCASAFATISKTTERPRGPGCNISKFIEDKFGSAPELVRNETVLYKPRPESKRRKSGTATSNTTAGDEQAVIEAEAPTLPALPAAPTLGNVRQAARGATVASTSQSA